MDEPNIKEKMEKESPAEIVEEVATELQERKIEKKKSPKGTKSLLILIGMAIILLIVGAGGAIYLLSQREEVEINPIGEEEDLYDFTGWKTYTNTTHGYSLKYPSNWTLDDSEADFSTVEEGIDATLTISKGGYYFNLKQWVGGRGGLSCIFSDGDSVSLEDIETDIGGGSYEEFDTSVLLDNPDEHVYRRNESGISTKDDAVEIYRVCVRGTMSDSAYNYAGYTQYGEVTYSTPVEPDSEMLDLLDQIFYSLEAVDAVEDGEEEAADEEEVTVDAGDYEDWTPGVLSAVDEAGASRVFYIKDSDTDDNEDNELWAMDVNGDNKVSVGVTGVIDVYHRPGTQWVLFRTFRDTGSWGSRFWIFNYVLGELKEMLEPNTDDYTSSIDFSGLDAVSPAGMHVLYNVNFFEATPEFDLPEEYDPYPDRKVGYYAYDLASDTEQYLGNFLTISGWDEGAENVYITNGYDYHEYEFADKIYKINVSTGASTFVEDADAFSYWVYRFEELGTDLIHWGDTTEGSKVIFREGGSETDVDTGDWADLQPHTWTSPDRSEAVYRKEHHYTEGIPYFSLRLVDTSTGDVSTILDPGADENFNNMVWVDNENVVVYRTVGDFPDQDRNIVKINVNTGVKTDLTDADGDWEYFAL